MGDPFAALNLEPPLSDHCKDIQNRRGKTIEVCPVELPGTIPPKLGVWSNEEIWKKWGFGDEADSSYPDVRFPVEYMDQFQRHFAARFIDDNEEEDEDSEPISGDLDADAAIQLFEKIGKPVILMVHSASAGMVLPILENSPDLIKALIVIEPAFLVDNNSAAIEGFADKMRGKPFLAVYGDYIDSRRQTNRKEGVLAVIDALDDLGTKVGLIDLPLNYGIYGNTHLMMQDNNNDFISRQIMGWLKRNINKHD